MPPRLPMGSAACKSCTSGAMPEKLTHLSRNSVDDRQARADLNVKMGGVAANAFALENRGGSVEFDRCYRIEKPAVGLGSCSSVFRCVNLENEQASAVKVINRKKFHSCHGESGIMRLLDHPNIVRLVETFSDGQNMYLVLELCEGGELFDAIVDRGQFPEREAAVCTQQMLRAVNYLHANRFVHRDLKAENWLLAEDRAPACTTLKLCDFGLACKCGPGERLHDRVGTPYYVSPEVIAGDYDAKADMWSVGVVIHMMLCGSPPFVGKDTQEVLKIVAEAKLPMTDRATKSLSPLAKSTLVALLQRDPGRRPTSAEALEGDWIQKLLKPGKAGAQHGFTKKNLQSVACAGRMAQAALCAVASQLGRGDVRELEQAFIAMDKNGDGMLSASEFLAGLKASGVKVDSKEVAKLMKDIDLDGSGAVDYSEFVAATMDKAKHLREESCLNAFRRFDLDGNGTIERSELGKLLRSGQLDDEIDADPDEVEEIFSEIDKNRDGKIDFDEFMVVLNSIGAKTSN